MYAVVAKSTEPANTVQPKTAVKKSAGPQKFRQIPHWGNAVQPALQFSLKANATSDRYLSAAPAVQRMPDESSDVSALQAPNKAPSCNEICGEADKCIQEPGEHCDKDKNDEVLKAWEKAAKETAKAITHLKNTPNSAEAKKSLTDNFAWDGKTPADLPTKVADKLGEGLDKMSENLCIKCRPCSQKGNLAQIVRARGQDCLNHNCFVICNEFFDKSNKPIQSHVLLHELLHRVVSNKAKMDLYRGQPGYPGGTAVAQTMPDPYASVVDDLK